MNNRRTIAWSLAIGAATAAAITAAVCVTTRGEDPPPPLPPPDVRQARLDAINAELAQARAVSEQFKAQQAQLLNDVMYRRRALDAASDPKVQTILKSRGIADPDAAYDLFPYQWQVDWLYEEPDASGR